MCKRLFSWILLFALLLGLSQVAAPFAVAAEPTDETAWEMYQNFQAIDPTLFLYDPAEYLKTSYGYDDAQVDYMRALTNQIAYGCTTPQDKIFSVVRYLATTVGYDYDYYIHQTHPYPPRDPVAVLNNRYTVCSGYAECSEIFLQFLGVPCITVSSPDHAWNMAYIGSRWMLFDVTWISGSYYEYGTLHTDSNLYLTWYDFSFQQAVGEANHRPLSMPYTQYGGTLYSFPPRSQFTSFTIPSTVTRIAEDAFGWNMCLKQVTVPDSVTVIADRAFYDCENLEQVTFGNGVTYIGKEAFAFCYSLSSVHLPDGVTQIGEEAFAFCHALSSVRLPDSVTVIADRAFYDCEKLQQVTFGNGVTQIGEEAFAFCYALSSVRLPDGVTHIGNRTFYVCNGLASIYLPTRLTTLGSDAFATYNADTTVYGSLEHPLRKTIEGSGLRYVAYHSSGYLYGDVDRSGTVNSTDARLLLQLAVGKITSDSVFLAVADVNGDGRYDSTDARLILQFSVGKLHSF